MDSLEQDILSRLSRDMGGDVAVGSVISMYLEKLPAESSGLHDYAESGDLASLGENAHRLKSSTAMLGASHLADILAAVETAAKADDADSAVRRLGEFDTERKKVERDLFYLLKR